MLAFSPTGLAKPPQLTERSLKTARHTETRPGVLRCARQLTSVRAGPTTTSLGQRGLGVTGHQAALVEPLINSIVLGEKRRKEGVEQKHSLVNTREGQNRGYRSPLLQLRSLKGREAP